MNQLAAVRSVEDLMGEFDSLSFIPYAPVRSQLLKLLACVNRIRRKASLEAGAAVVSEAKKSTGASLR
jgi:hypothetical protein